LRTTLKRLPLVEALLMKPEVGGVSGLKGVHPHQELAARLDLALEENPPPHAHEGGIFRDGVDPELDELRSLARGGKDWIARFEAEEIQRTGISSLKVGFNRVFGFYIEVTHVHQSKVPPAYVRKQTLKNAERYITPELKDRETTVLHAEERAKERERVLFEQLRDEVGRQLVELQETARSLAELDVTASLAQVAQENAYVRPEVDESTVLEIQEGRHPVLDRTTGKKFVPNDTKLDTDGEQIWLITGPNMAGKSTFIRQNALLVLLAQMGGFVPAKRARIGLVDRIFTRSGAADEISRGWSTFMVEMNETANILHHATKRSLVILDEIGRGTSTYDGVSIAWAVTEFLHERVGSRTLFATHYHELTELVKSLPRTANYHVEVREWGEDIIFLHRIVPGPTDRSYGIHVARLAGIPHEVVVRAREVLCQLETSHGIGGKPGPKARRGALRQLGLFRGPEDGEAEKLRKVVGDLQGIDVNGMTPVEALARLAAFIEEARRLGERQASGITGGARGSE
jgi:DNA mismatch repair protein MutS